MVAAAPALGSRPVTALAAAARASGVYADSSQVPTLIGEVILSTRSMLMNRAGRPRSCTSAAIDRLIAAAAPVFAVRASATWRELFAPAATPAEAPANPPRNRILGISAHHAYSLRPCWSIVGAN